MAVTFTWQKLLHFMCKGDHGFNGCDFALLVAWLKLLGGDYFLKTKQKKLEN